MKIKKQLWIVVASVLFLFATIYFFQKGEAETAPAPLPPATAIDSTKCIAPAAYMRANHMQILYGWRNASVRQGNRVHVAANGSRFQKSLNTCLGCHSNNRFFCYNCHSYANVKPKCWNCHLSPMETPR
ncbi:MAG: sulfate reduction electron transfer complex DsrMKJOP subunit DsrJ [Chlorobium sp.]|nr:sulfate reduction electron transfer complex DsrMKJOP subunit DsrJ [Chlorobium sp.]